MCMGGGGGPSKAAQAQEAENARLAKEREEERRGALVNPEDRFQQLEDNAKPLRRRGRKGLTIDLEREETNSGLSIK